MSTAGGPAASGKIRTWRKPHDAYGLSRFRGGASAEELVDVGPVLLGRAEVWRRLHPGDDPRDRLRRWPGLKVPLVLLLDEEAEVDASQEDALARRALKKRH